jgi:cytochrome c oxidase cbb3-type subunit 3
VQGLELHRMSQIASSPKFLPGGFVAAAALVLCSLLLAATVSSQDQQPGRSNDSAAASRPADESLADGRQIFESRCSGCHGLDGRGGERAPDIATAQKTQGQSDAALAHVVENGIPAGGMPAFPMLDSSRVKSLIGYLRFLQGKTRSAKLPGDPRNGKTLFSRKARCSECHMVQGEGGFMASDLSLFGRTHSVGEIRDAITKPGNVNRQDAAVVVTTRAAQKYSGIVRNEDNFSLQLQTLDGAFHLFMKSELDGIARQPDSLMPSDYGATLNPGELNDLISFLMSAANDAKGAASSKKSEQDEEDE